MKNEIHQNELSKLADSFASTDTFAIKQDVCRLGSIRAAAEYSSKMAIGQPDWESLSSDEGVAALELAIRDIVLGMRVEAGEGEDHDTGIINTVDGENVTVNWDSLVRTPASFRDLRPL